MVQCKAERYINNVYAGVTTLHFPEIDDITTADIPTADSYSYVKAIVGDGVGTGFTVPEYETSYTPASHLNFPMSHVYDTWRFTSGGTSAPVFEFRLVSSDNNDRRIIVTASNLWDTDPSLANHSRGMWLTFTYKLNGVNKFVSGNTNNCNVGLSQGTIYNTLRQSIQTFPFLNKDGTKVAYVGYSCRAVQELDTSHLSYYCNGVAVSTDTGVSGFKEWMRGGDFEPDDDDNPYHGGGDSEEGGGGGNFSEDSDDPTTDDLPTIDAVGTGFATLFTPSRAQLKNLSGLFWNSNVFTFLQNLVENITDMFVSLAMVPFQVTAGSTVSVTWLGIDTAVSLTLASAQFYEFDMGTINLGNDNRIFTSGSALDYSPFSTLGIYLPFIGYRELDVDECRDASINLRYRIDILSGSCVAILRVAGRDIYEFTGNCLTQIPITNENMQSLVSDAVNVGLAINNAQAAEAAAGATVDAANAKGKPLADDKAAHIEQAVERSEGSLASATANAAMGMKPHFAKTGAVSGSVAMMSVKQPYLFLRTPRQAVPARYQRYCGFPSNITGKLGDFSGYTVVEDIRLNGLVATSPEVAEIYRLLKSGVII